jgi:hypothetical protein
MYKSQNEATLSDKSHYHRMSFQLAVAVHVKIKRSKELLRCCQIKRVIDLNDLDRLRMSVSKSNVSRLVSMYVRY